MLSIVGCGRSSFEGLLQPLMLLNHAFYRCGRSSFEGLLQQPLLGFFRLPVVEGPVLRDYYNYIGGLDASGNVVEGPVLRDYYNTNKVIKIWHVLWKVQF